MRLGAAARQKQGTTQDKTGWGAAFGPWALCLPPVEYWIKVFSFLLCFAKFLPRKVLLTYILAVGENSHFSAVLLAWSFVLFILIYTT